MAKNLTAFGMLQLTEVRDPSQTPMHFEIVE